MTLLRAKEIYKSYGDLQILQNLNFSISAGESIAIMGPSGVGKSTLLHILGLLDTPDQGHIILDNCPAQKSQYPRLRNQHIGFVFQAFHLLEEESVLTNVLMPAKIARQDATDRAYQLIEQVGLSGREKQLAKYLSGGEKQRIAIARALCNDPALIFADEPTGNLDAESSQTIQNLLFSSSANKGLVIVTHDQALANQCDKIYQLDAGRLMHG